MLLETLDIKKNDILIYSQNIFDLENNFKIIYKDDPEKKPFKVSYGDVCRYINEFTPKNLIVYRLLINIPEFELFKSKYGFFININGLTELIFFDPIFAVKELEDYSDSINYDLRFRIQQVGLTTLNRMNNLPNYAEIYNADMQALEAKNQNDKVFADAIFSEEKQVKKNQPASSPPMRKNTEQNSILDTKIQEKKSTTFERYVSEKVESNIAKIKPDKAEQSLEKPFGEMNISLKKDISIIKHKLAEDNDFDYSQIMKINFRDDYQHNNQKEEKNLEIEINTKPRPKSESAFGKFLQNKQINQQSEGHISLGDVSKDHLTDLFKSPSSLKDIFEGRDKKVVLKLHK